MALKDLREELRARIRLVIAERGQLEERITFLREQEEKLASILKYEEMRIRYEQDSFTLPLFTERDSEPDRSKYALFLQDALAGMQPRSLEDLKQAALEARIDFEGKQPGRVLHFALLGMSKNGAVEMVSNGVWRRRAATAKVGS